MHTLLIGFDSFDPRVFERLASQGRLPALGRYADAGHYARLEVSDPPQTEVCWTSIATGLDPGGHGIFDYLEDNHDHWGADHCMDSQAVPGVFFSSRGLEGLAKPSYREIPELALGKALEQHPGKPPLPPSSRDEDREVVEQRLKDLGYL